MITKFFKISVFVNSYEERVTMKTGLNFFTDLNYISKEDLEKLTELIKTGAEKLGIHNMNKVKVHLTFRKCIYLSGC